MSQHRCIAHDRRVLVALVVVAALGCSEADVRPDDESLFARRFLPASPEQRQAADELIESCYRSALEHGWYDFDVGMKSGYEPMFNDAYHYQNPDYVLDDRILDPERPEFLMYYQTPEGPRLFAFMFYVRTLKGNGPQLGGNLTRWHFHVWREAKCLVDGVLSLGPAKDGGCDRGVLTHRSPEMIHVWLGEHDAGPFATRMGLNPEMREEFLAKRARERPETVVGPSAPDVGS